ncbi:MAG: hypothetical protein HYX42_14575 [Polaromonas sp.]|uniref:hypothetical protein n=1 Tax=Polaromonas sp. TaxID=1869339 RepID=UPI0025D37D1B|nr:hypothetical protein [Polaromonas sp.]MBI2727465.1 hypothetical protein [Polaromonas sp.]
MNSIPAVRHRLQQQPHRVIDRQQQQSSGSGEFQPRQQGSGARPGQLGESNRDRERHQLRGAGQ